jgi:hypothetical protein
MYSLLIHLLQNQMKTELLAYYMPRPRICFPNQYIHCGILDSSDWLAG